MLTGLKKALTAVAVLGIARLWGLIPAAAAVCKGWTWMEPPFENMGYQLDDVEWLEVASVSWKRAQNFGGRDRASSLVRVFSARFPRRRVWAAELLGLIL